MGGILVKSQSSFSFHLEGDNFVDAIILAETLNNISELAQITAYDQDNDSFIKLNVTAFREGCFEIAFQTVCEVTRWAFLNPLVASNFSYSVVNTVVGMFQLKKFLKGEKPRSTVPAVNNTVNITNLNGNLINIPEGSTLIINNYHADATISNLSTLIHKNNPSGSFTIKAEDSETTYSPQDIECMSRTFPFHEESIETLKVEKSEVIMPIIKGIFKGNAKWCLLLNNKSIAVHIEDESWLNSVQTGKVAITSDLALHAILKSEIKLDENGKPIHNSIRYTIIKVIDLVDIPKDSSEDQLKLE